MRRFLMALCAGAALAGAVWAQPAPPAVNSPPAPVMVADPPPAGACGPSCTHKACVPEVATKTIKKVTYDSRCEDFCLPRCPGFHHTHSDCNGCEHVDCPKCGRVHTRKVLIKKVREIDCDGFKCVPAEVADCAHPGCCAGGARPAPAGPAEGIPAPSASTLPPGK